MAFFASPDQELYEYRLRRSSSTTSIRTRYRPSGSQRSLSRSHFNSSSPSLPLASTSDAPPAQYKPSQAPVSSLVPRPSSPLPSAIQDLRSPSESSQGSTPPLTAEPGDSASFVLGRQRNILRPNLGQQDSLPSTPSPSASSSRSKTMFDTGSDSGLVSRTPRAYCHLDVSSTHEGRLSTVTVRLASADSPNHSLGDSISDECSFERSPSPLHPSRLDLKRLLSKPAAASVVSNLSIASDPESHTLPRSPRNPSKAWPSKVGVTTHPKLISGPPDPPPRPEQILAPHPQSVQQRPNNLQRKKLCSGLTHATRSASDTPISSQLQPTFHPPATAAPSRSPRSLTPESLIGGCAAVPASSPSGRLTPAGAIAQAYKEHDRRREALAIAIHTEKLLPIIPVRSPPFHASEQDATPTAETTSHSSGLDGFPDSFVMVDSAQEELCHAHDQAAASAVQSASAGAGLPIRSLTRKVSARFLRGLAAVSGAGAHQGRGHADGEGDQTDRRRTNDDRHERQRSFSPPKAKRKLGSLELSIDSPVRSGQNLAGNSTQGESTMGLAHAKSKNKRKGQEKDDTNTGARLWRLVKRISAGGLRERFQSANTPPPLPPMPTELPPLPPQSAFEMQLPLENANRDRGSDVCQGIEPNQSASGVALHDDGHSPTVTYMPSGANASSKSLGVGSHPRRPSISSSPQSSELASSRFFRSHSSRSSFSSILGNSPPPPPPVPIHALERSPSPRARSRSRSRDGPSVSARGTSRDEPKNSNALPSRLRKRSSPDLPTISVTEAVNNFIFRRPSLTRRKRHHAPAQSLSRIMTTPVGGVSTPPLRRAGSDVRPGTRQRRGDRILSPGMSGQNRDSGGSDMTVRRMSASAATVSASGANAGNAVGRLTFRELGSTQRPAWTTQEKEDKWDDLLKRSAIAGGTLHLGAGNGQLASDNIRFSSSTLASET